MLAVTLPTISFSTNLSSQADLDYLFWSLRLQIEEVVSAWDALKDRWAFPADGASLRQSLAYAKKAETLARDGKYDEAVANFGHTLTHYMRYDSAQKHAMPHETQTAPARAELAAAY